MKRNAFHLLGCILSLVGIRLMRRRNIVEAGKVDGWMTYIPGSAIWEISAGERINLGNRSGKG